MQFFHGGGDGLAYDTLAAPIVSQDGQLYKAYSYFSLYPLCKVNMTGIVLCLDPEDCPRKSEKSAN